MGICPFRPKDMQNAHFNVKLDLMKSELFRKIHMKLKSHKKKIYYYLFLSLIAYNSIF